MSEKYCLQWNDFQTTVSNSFKIFRQEEDFFDVTLVTDDEVQMSAHKLILSACSSFFKTILKKNPHPNPLIYLHGVDSTNLGYILDYIYHGEVQLFQEHLDPFMDKAQTLRISGLISSGEDRVGEAGEEQNPIDVKKEEHVTETTRRLEEEFNIESKSRQSERNKAAESIKTVAVTGDNFDLKKTINQMITWDNDTYICKTCGRMGKDLSNLKKHAEIHIEGLSYECPHCDKTFRSKNSYSKHNSRCHK